MNAPSLNVISSPFAPEPRPPTPGEQGVRLVRHGMADVLAWLGEKPGPQVDDLVHTTYVVAGNVVAHPDTVAMIRGAITS